MPQEPENFCRPIDCERLDIKSTIFVHEVKNAEDKRQIIANGFILGKNPSIYRGVYARPYPKKIWYEAKHKIGKRYEKISEVVIEIEVDPSARVFQIGNEYPIHSLRGYGNLEWNKMYVEAAKKIGIQLPVAQHHCDPYWDSAHGEQLNNLMFEMRQPLVNELNTIIKNRCDILINGGEVIIVNPTVIRSMK